MQNLSLKLRESIASTLQKSNIAFPCDIDMHAFGTPGIWSFTRWILTISKVLMIPQQFLSSGGKSGCFITFPMQDQNKREKLILRFMVFAGQNDSSVKRCLCCMCVYCTSSSSNESVQADLLKVHFYMKRSDLWLFSIIFGLVYTHAIIHLLNFLISLCESEVIFGSLHHSQSLSMAQVSHFYI